MSMEPQVSLVCKEAAPSCDFVSQDGSSGAIISSQDPSTPQLTVKKQPRQWAAWTRQEEESFFSALRQVGKNFEKITCRVQSKNKDQVRHYYYRLVRRMNKLLGPDLSLDAKNSKVTNAAMLRWWSLLEKYSCKASKLHLKPRRYKLFVETLENQLLRDRRKNTRKQPSQGENNSASAPNTVSNQGRVLGHDSLAVKEVSADSQKIQKLGSGKGLSVKRHTNVGINRNNCKAEPSAVKAAKHRRKKGASTAAYRKWEKAAIAGVSLVADAAEHLERTATNKEVEHFQDRHFQSGTEHAKENMHPLQTSSQNIFNEDNVQGSMKLKLQLFPMDESTRRALEMDNHNPHLELTLSTRKKISSVLEHLNRKWGNSSIACGELMLFPYSVPKENLMGYQKWTKESSLNAADVYALVGSPSVFRLRYGWFPNAELGSAMLQLPSSFTFAAVSGHNANMNYRKEQQNADLVPTLSHEESCRLSESIKDQLLPAAEVTTVTPLIDSPTTVHGSRATTASNVNILRYSAAAPTLSLPRRDCDIDTVTRQIDCLDDVRTHKATAPTAGEWADSLTNISVGDLLSEASHNVDAHCIDSPVPCSSHSLQQIPFSCDSFDAAIAAHIYKHQSKDGIEPVPACHGSSIWDAEETCDGFAFQKNGFLSGNIQGLPSYVETGKEIARSSSAAVEAAIQELDGAEEPLDDHPVQDLVDEYHSDSPAQDLNGLTDIYWPDSLGPLDLDIPFCRYRSEDLILSDSLGGLNRLIASSLDAFQCCSFFGLDKKEPALSVEARESASFADYKIGTEV